MKEPQQYQRLEFLPLNPAESGTRYLPENCGSRFAKNAGIPSAKSAPSAARTNRSSSRSRCASRPSTPAASFISILAAAYAAVGPAARLRASSATAPSKQSSSYTSLTSPQLCASSEVKRRPSNARSAARRAPISLGKKNVVLSAPVRAVLKYAYSKVARRDATTRSQHIANPNPP